MGSPSLRRELSFWAMTHVYVQALEFITGSINASGTYSLRICCGVGRCSICDCPCDQLGEGSVRVSNLISEHKNKSVAEPA